MRLHSCVRESDTAARLGGDEFVISLPNISKKEDAEIVTQKILQSLSAPFQIEQHSLHIGCSIGVSLYPADGGDAGALVRAADTAMYDAKENGRGIYCFFKPVLNAAEQSRQKRTVARRVGKEWYGTCRIRWSPYT